MGVFHLAPLLKPILTSTAWTLSRCTSYCTFSTSESAVAEWHHNACEILIPMLHVMYMARIAVVCWFEMSTVQKLPLSWKHRPCAVSNQGCPIPLLEGQNPTVCSFPRSGTSTRPRISGLRCFSRKICKPCQILVWNLTSLLQVDTCEFVFNLALHVTQWMSDLCLYRGCQFESHGQQSDHCWVLDRNRPPCLPSSSFALGKNVRRW